MHELVLVLSDFYVSQETPDRELPAGVTLPGLQHVTRFGTRSHIAEGWRPWLSQWLTGTAARPTPNAVATAAAPAIATTVAAASVAAAALASPGNAVAPAASPAPASAGTTQITTPAMATTSQAIASAPVAWIATPMHLIAGMTSIHVDRRSILRLDPSDQAVLAADFQRVFHDSGFSLQPLAAGDFLMLGPEAPVAEGLEPARAMGASMADAHRAHAANPMLLRLGAELEMWLHDHPVNDVRKRRGDLPVTALWLWGGGRIDTVRPHEHTHATETATATAAIAFGRDSYLNGLWSTPAAARVSPLPKQLAEVFGYPQTERAVLVIEIGLMLQSNPTWTFFEALVHIDRTFILPAVEALNRGQYQRLVILANDYEVTLTAKDRLKFWRRTPLGLSGLQ